MTPSTRPATRIASRSPLAEHLRDAGFEVALLEAEPGRPNLVADLPGERDGQTLCLLGHVDTVPADPGEWSFSPWSGDVVDGDGPRPRRPGHEGPGRGRGRRCDLARALRLAPGEGALKLVITADEEMGAALGAQWLCREHPEAVRSDLVVNEGGGRRVRARRQALLHALRRREGRQPLPAARPRRRRARLGPGARRQRAAEAGAGSDPVRLRAAAGADRGRDRLPRAVLGEDLAGAEGSELEAAVERLRGLSPPLAAYIAEPMLRVTMVPTRAHASDKDNVIPSQAEVLVDCRVPPGGGADEARARAEQLLGPLADGLEIEFTEPVDRATAPPPNRRSPTRSPRPLAEFDPDATLVPIVMPGFSDSHWFRKAFGSATVYGFCPQRDAGAVRGGAAGPRRRRARRRLRRRARGRLLRRLCAGGCSDERARRGGRYQRRSA